MSMIHLTSTQLRQAADLKDQIANLQTQLATVFGGQETPSPVETAKSVTNPVVKPVVAKKRGMSAAGKARVVAAQKARWAKIKAAKTSIAPTAKPVAKAGGVAKPAGRKGKISPEGMARIIAATKARWAKVKAAKAAKVSKK
jgi:hypothetical protein